MTGSSRAEGQGSDLVPEPRWFRKSVVMANPDVVAGPDERYLFRSTDILVAGEDAERFEQVFSQVVPDLPGPLIDIERSLAKGPGAGPDTAGTDSSPFGLRRYRIQAEEAVDLTVVVDAIRDEDPRIALDLNYVVCGAPDVPDPNIHGGPGGFAMPAGDPGWKLGDPGDGVVIGLVDTGIALKDDGTVEHPALVGRCFPLDPDTTSEAYDGHPFKDLLDDEAGHGTFAAGVLVHAVPEAKIIVARGLEGDGVGDVFDIAQLLEDLHAAGAKIIVMPFGGYTSDDEPPLALATAIQAFPSDVVFVAAAGNGGSNRRCFPAAMSEVVGVAALDCEPTTGPCRPVPAAYSNRGGWVEASALGERISTFLFNWTDPARAINSPENPKPVLLPSRKFDGWARWYGTSFAAPAVAGAIARLMVRQKMTGPDAVAALTRGTNVKHIRGFGALVPEPRD